MNETLKNIAERYSCRDFADTPLTDEQIEALIGAALAAPSAINLQPWRLSVVTDKGLIDEIDAEGMAILAAGEDKAYYERMMSRGGKIFYNAPSLFAISSDGSSYAALDSGIMCQNIVLAAQSLGLGTCIIGMLRIPLSGPRGDEFKKRLKFPDGFDFAISVIVGTARSGKEPHEPDRGKVFFVNT